MTQAMSNDEIKPTLNVPPPPNRRQTRGLPQLTVTQPEIQPEPVAIPDNMSKPNAGVQDMNFKMSILFHRAFKLSAAKRNMAMKEMLEASFRCWVDNHGDEEDKSWLPPTT